MRVRNFVRAIAGAVFIGLTVAFCYRAILLPAQASLYPWASDTLGHVLKGEYMQRQLGAGVLYPDLLPSWYAGLQMLRYHSPLPYYLLAVLNLIVGDSVAAASWFIALCALIGGLGWLPYRRWIGWLPAAAGGALFVFLPDNVRVALAEGNLPRVLATALLPWTVYLLMRSLEEGSRRWYRIGVAACFMLIVLSHAMMAAIYAACCALLCILLWLGKSTTAQRAVASIAFVALGVLLAGWWLLPSVVGGITDLNAAAMTEALAVFPLTTYLNPTLRAGDPEIVYPGAALLLLAVVLLLVKRGRSAQVVALTLIGLFGVLITTPGFNDLFNSLPLHHLFWPLRFLGFASFALLLALAWRLREWSGRLVVAGVLVGVILVGDGALSLPLIRLRPARTEVMDVTSQLATLRGWREATLDYSRLGSAPSYFFSSVAGREQIFGWAYQGARTARNVSAIDEALQQGFAAYAVDRLNLLGVDDIVRLDTQPMTTDLPAELAAAGFAEVSTDRSLALFHRDGEPRAFRANWRALGIGRGAQNLAYLFPQVIVGTSAKVDDYTFDELSSYETLILAGFEWHDRRAAEELVQQVAQAGVRVLVDLTGVRDDPLARQPSFLGVWGEGIFLGHDALRLEGDGASYQLLPFSSAFRSWKAYTPQGLDRDLLQHPYFGMWSTALGYKQVGAGRVWFIGLNLPFHAVLTKDPVVIDLLTKLLDMPAGERNAYAPVPLVDYFADPRGYRFGYALDEADRLLVPLAYHDGMHVDIDGQPARLISFENLVAFEAPAGRHQVSISIAYPPIYVFGIMSSILALAGVVGATLLPTKRRSGRAEVHDEQNAIG